MRLDKFLTGVDASYFFKKIWGKEILKFDRSSLFINEPGSLLSDILNNKRIYYPQFRVLSGGGALSPTLYTESDRFGLSERVVNKKIMELAVAPNTIKIEDLASIFNEFKCWEDAAQRIFNSRITLNGYFSFGPADGVPIHYDPHHIFAIQLFGSKKWKLSSKQDEFFPHKSITLADNEDNTEYIEFSLNPGEMLYVPPGRVHSVSTDRQSIHVALGIHTPRCFESVIDLVDKALKSTPELRADMPFSVTDDNIIFRELSKDEMHKIMDILKFYYDL